MIQVKVQKSISTEFQGALDNNSVSNKEKIRLRLSPDDIFQWLIVGGGLVSIAKAIIDYKKIFQNKRTVSINIKDQIINIETQSIDELKELLKEAKTIFVEVNKQDND